MLPIWLGTLPTGVGIVSTFFPLRLAAGLRLGFTAAVVVVVVGVVVVLIDEICVVTDCCEVTVVDVT